MPEVTVFGLLESGFQQFYWGNALMIAIGLGFIYLAIAKKMEPLLLIPIGFGIMLVNLPLGGMMDYEYLLRAPQSGMVMTVEMEEGDRFKKGGIILTLDSGEVTAPVFGRIDAIKVSKAPMSKKVMSWHRPSPWNRPISLNFQHDRWGFSQSSSTSV